MLTRKTLKKELGDIALTSSMIQKIEEWNSMLYGEAPWIDRYVSSMRIEEGICREFADVVLSEMEVTISNEQLKEKFDKCMEDLPENFMDALGLGSMCIRPLGDGTCEFVTADRFIPIKFDSAGKVIDCAFIETVKVNDHKYHIRMERHSITSGFLVITNKAFESDDSVHLKYQIPLDTEIQWENIPEEISYPDMPYMDFGYYKNPLKNRIDNTPCGVSIFDSAISHIRRADIQGARLDWEYESGERAVHVDSRVLRRNPDGSNGVAKLNRRLYRGLDMDDGKDPIKVFSPELRDANLINGLEAYFRQIEFTVGLAFGDLSDPQSVEKTAEEIKSSKRRKYNRVNQIQNKLKDCIEDFVIGLAFHEGMLRSGYELTVAFHDSILTDEETDRQLMLSEIAAGIRSAWEYRVEYLGEDEQTARNNVPVGGVLIE